MQVSLCTAPSACDHVALPRIPVRGHATGHRNPGCQYQSSKRRFQLHTCNMEAAGSSPRDVSTLYLVRKLCNAARMIILGPTTHHPSKSHQIDTNSRSTTGRDMFLSEKLFRLYSPTTMPSSDARRVSSSSKVSRRNHPESCCELNLRLPVLERHCFYLSVEGPRALGTVEGLLSSRTSRLTVPLKTARWCKDDRRSDPTGGSHASTEALRASGLVGGSWEH